MMFDLPLPLLADIGAPPPPIVPLKQETFSGQSSVDVLFGELPFEEVLILVDQWVPSADAVPRWRTSSDGGATFDSGATDYWAHAVQHNPSTTASGFNGNISHFQFGVANSGQVDTALGRACFLTRFWRPHDATVRTFMDIRGGWDRNTASDAMTAVGSGYRDAAAKVDAVRLLSSAGTMSGRLVAWGVLI